VTLLLIGVKNIENRILTFALVQTMTSIKHTEDYSLFKRIIGNRSVSKPHIKRLTDAISSNTSCVRYNPILVNEKYEVIDGQHRLEAIKNLELPVYYLMEEGLTLKNVQALNSLMKPWSPMSYARSYSELGNKNYDTYLEFKKRFQLNHDILVRFLALDFPITTEMFKAGDLRIMDKSKSFDLCSKLVDLGQYYPRYNMRSFAFAFKRIWENEKYNHDKMVNKIEKYANKIEDYSLVEDYMRALEMVYNHNDSKRVRFF